MSDRHTSKRNRGNTTQAGGNIFQVGFEFVFSSLKDISHIVSLVLMFLLFEKMSKAPVTVVSPIDSPKPEAKTSKSVKSESESPSVQPESFPPETPPLQPIPALPPPVFQHSPEGGDQIGGMSVSRNGPVTAQEGIKSDVSAPSVNVKGSGNTINVAPPEKKHEKSQAKESSALPQKTQSQVSVQPPVIYVQIPPAVVVPTEPIQPTQIAKAPQIAIREQDQQPAAPPLPSGDRKEEPYNPPVAGDFQDVKQPPSVPQATFVWNRPSSPRPLESNSGDNSPFEDYIDRNRKSCAEVPSGTDKSRKIKENAVTDQKTEKTDEDLSPMRSGLEPEKPTAQVLQPLQGAAKEAKSTCDKPKQAEEIHPPLENGDTSSTEIEQPNWNDQKYPLVITRNLEEKEIQEPIDEAM
jgi:hypothetical protein